MRAPAPHLVRRGIIASSLALVLALTVLAPLHPAAAAPAATAVASLSGTISGDEAQFYFLLNQTRAQSGLPALQNDVLLANSSRTWSNTMGAKDLLYHDPNLAAIIPSIEPSWRYAAENVGFGYQVQQLHDAFMASAGHRANILASRFNRVGIGVAHANGKIWVTVRFIEGPALAVTVAPPPPTPPGVRTVLTGDFNADGRDDMLTYGPGSEADELWFGLIGGTMRQVAVSINGQYQPVAGDFDADGRTEILWYAPGSAADSLWEWSGTGWAKVAKTINGRYTARAGDFDADGADDIFWYAPGDATDYRWYGNRSGAFSSVATTVAGSFLPVVGDYDGNGGDDVLWYARGSATDTVWFSTGQRGTQRSARTTIGGSHTPFTGDFDGNGVDDIFLYTAGTAPDHTWFNTRTAFAANKVARTVNGTYLGSAGDFDGNGVDDAVWFSPSGAAGDPLWWGVRSALDFLTSVLRPG